ncbi:MAG: TonB family protein [Candidatus Omnitrophica bacterium]|nr:TonB family protein [Candidatus Omnitrophota bacterium]
MSNRKSGFVKTKFYFSLGVFSFLIFCFIPRSEGNIYSKDWQDDEVGTVQMIVGDTRGFPTNTPHRIAINNPEIADVVDASNTEITVSAKSPGSTTLTFTDIQGEQVIKIRVIPEDVEELKYRVDKLLETLNFSEIYTQGLPEEGKVAILGKVNNQQDKERIATILGTQLREKVVDLTLVKEDEVVVDIDVQVLEVDRGSTKTLGFTWPSGVTVNEIGSPGITSQGNMNVTNQGGFVTTSTTQATPGTGWGTLFRVLNLSRDAFQLTISALVQEGKARILSRPRLACQSGKEAELFVGGEKPVFTTQLATSTGSQGTNIEYKEYGIKLKVKPTLTEDASIKLALNVEVSEIGEADTIGTTSNGTISAKAYPLTKRSATTELFINDGQTLAIGGLIKQKSEESINKVPGLGDVPILGALFRNKSSLTGGGANAKSNTELFITLTPTIIMNKSAKKIKIENGVAAPIVISAAGQVNPQDASRENFMSVMEYSSIVQKRILQSLAYPSSAKAAGFAGTVKLGLHISYIGDLMDAQVKQSSGYKILDDDAIKTAKSIGTYPPFPSFIDAKDIWIDVPIIYKAD